MCVCSTVAVNGFQVKCRTIYVHPLAPNDICVYIYIYVYIYTHRSGPEDERMYVYIVRCPRSRTPSNILYVLLWPMPFFYMAPFNFWSSPHEYGHLIPAVNAWIFRRVCKIAKSDSQLRPVRPHETTRLPLDGFWWNLIYRLFFFSKICQENPSFFKKSDKLNGYFAWRRFHIYDNISLNYF